MDPAPIRKTRPPRPQDTEKEPDDEIPLPKPVEPVKPTEPEKREPVAPVAIAPEPHLPPVRPVVPIPEPIAIAPEPRVTRPALAAPPGFASEWERIGDVEARITGVAVTRVPITDIDGIASESPHDVFAVWVEVRTTTKKRTVEARRWQDSLGSYAEIAPYGGSPLGRALLGDGATLRTGLPYKQVLPPDGTPRIDLVAVGLPPVEARDLRMTLDAERVGETGKFRFSIPASAWKK